jgi:hypothetical protein
MLHATCRTEDDTYTIDSPSACVATLHRAFTHKQWNSLINLRLYLTSSCLRTSQFKLLLNAIAQSSAAGGSSILQKLEVRLMGIHYYYRTV